MSTVNVVELRAQACGAHEYVNPDRRGRRPTQRKTKAKHAILASVRQSKRTTYDLIRHIETIGVLGQIKSDHLGNCNFTLFFLVNSVKFPRRRICSVLRTATATTFVIEGMPWENV